MMIPMTVIIFLQYIKSLIEGTYDLIKQGPITIHKLLRFIKLNACKGNTLSMKNSPNSKTIIFLDNYN